jgi:hypothetical protein
MRHGLLLLALVIFSGMSSNAVLGCGLIIPSIRDFDAKEYVFIGKVTGIVGPLKLDGVRGEAWGLAVQVEEKIYLPNKPKHNFEIFPFGVQSDCSATGWKSEDLIRSYPVGSQVRVIAIESRLLGRRLTGGDIRLVVPLGKSSIARNEQDGHPLTSATSAYNYEEFERHYGEFAASIGEKHARGGDPLNDMYRRLPEFELRKDLLRLKKAKTSGEMIAILERLASYPLPHFDYLELARTYIKNPAVLNRLYGMREERLRNRAA